MNKLLIFSLFFVANNIGNPFVTTKESVTVDYTDKILSVSGEILKNKNQFDKTRVSLEEELLGLLDTILRDKYKLKDQESKKLLEELQDIRELLKKYKVEMDKRLKSVEKTLKN